MKNTDFTLESISAMISSEDSLRALMDMITDMDLEIQEISIAYRGLPQCLVCQATDQPSKSRRLMKEAYSA